MKEEIVKESTSHLDLVKETLELWVNRGYLKRVDYLNGHSGYFIAETEQDDGL